MNRARSMGWLVAGVVGIVFFRICFNDFTWWDDPGTIFLNPRMTPPTLKSIGWYWDPRNAELSIFIPLTHTVWAALAAVAYAASGGDGTLSPHFFHAASVGLHAIGAATVYAILRRFLVISGDGGPSPAPRQEWAAAAGALLWGLHPIQVEAVAWASGLKDVLCGMLSLAAVWQYVKAAEGWREREGRLLGCHYVLSLLACLGAMLAKPVGMMTPALIIIVDWVVLRRPLQKVLLAVGPWLLLSAAIAGIARHHQPPAGVEITPLWTRPLIAADSIAFYLGKIIWPVGLTVDYGRTPAVAMRSPLIWVMWLVPVGLGMLLWRMRRRHSLLTAAGLWFVAAPLPMLGFTAFSFMFYSTVADHYAYQAMVGPAIVVAWALDRYPGRAACLAAAIATTILAAISVFEMGHWHDDLSLWRRVVRVNPRSAVGYMSLGNAMARRGRHDEAEPMYRRALEINPSYIKGHDSMAGWLIGRGRLDEAVEHLRAFVMLTDALDSRVRPDNSPARFELGRILMKLDRPREALAEFEAVLSRNPADESARKGREAAQERLRAKGEG